MSKSIEQKDTLKDSRSEAPILPGVVRAPNVVCDFLNHMASLAVANILGFRAVGPAIYIAQPIGLGDGSRVDLRPPARRFAVKQAGRWLRFLIPRRT